MVMICQYSGFLVYASETVIFGLYIAFTHGLSNPDTSANPPTPEIPLSQDLQVAWLGIQVCVE